MRHAVSQSPESRAFYNESYMCLPGARGSGNVPVSVLTLRALPVVSRMATDMSVGNGSAGRVCYHALDRCALAQQNQREQKPDDGTEHTMTITADSEVLPKRWCKSCFRSVQSGLDVLVRTRSPYNPEMSRFVMEHLPRAAAVYRRNAPRIRIR